RVYLETIYEYMGALAANQAASITCRELRKRSNDLVAGQRRDHIGQASMSLGMVPIGPYLRQRKKHEAALGQARMGKHRRLGPLTQDGPIGQEIEIENARRIGQGTKPAEFR